MGMDHPFGITRGARGVKHRAIVMKSTLVNRLANLAWMGLFVDGTGFEQSIDRFDAALVIIAQAAIIVINNVAQLRALLADFQDLIGLLLILNHGDANRSISEHINHFGCHRILIHRNRNGTQALGCNHARVKPRAIIADECDVVAAFESTRSQPSSHLQHQG